MAHMGVGRASGKNKAEEAARRAVSSPLLETSINGARGVLVNVTGSTDVGLEEVEIAANLVQEAADPNALIIFGAWLSGDAGHPQGRELPEADLPLQGGHHHHGGLLAVGTLLLKATEDMTWLGAFFHSVSARHRRFPPPTPWGS